MEAAREYDAKFKQPDLDAPLTKGRFQGKVVVVTGGAQGIGRATLERFCNDGASVAIFDINRAEGTSLETKMASQGMKARFYEVDVAEKDQCLKAMTRVADDNGGMIHFIVSCAVYPDSAHIPCFELSTEMFKKVLDVNVIGVFNMVQAGLPFMKDKSECAVVSVGSVRGHCAALHQAGYIAGKGALLMLTKCMALDLSSHGVRVNSVSPVAVWTPSQVINGKLQRGSEYEKEFGNCLMTPRAFIESAGVASVIAFLCSKDAMYIDGTDIPVDCGYIAMGPEGPGY